MNNVVNIQWFKNLPASWKLLPNKYAMKKAKNICDHYNGEKILSLSMNGVIERDFNNGGKVPESFDGYQYINKGNLLMCLFDIDVTPRCIGIINDDGITSPAYSQFVMNDGFYNKYYYYYYLMLDNSKELLHFSKNLRHSLTEDQLGQLFVCVPPYDEQIKIAEFIDVKIKNIDQTIEILTKEINRLNELKNSYIFEYITKGIDSAVEFKTAKTKWMGLIPIHYKEMKLKHAVVEYGSGGTPESTNDNFYTDDGTPWLMISDMSTTDFVYDTEKHITKEAIESKNLKIYKKGTIIYAMYASVGKASELMVDATINQALLGIDFNKNIVTNEYIKFMFKAWEPHILSLSNGTTQFNLNAEKVMNLYCLFPPIDEQEKICGVLSSKCKNIDDLISNKSKQIDKLKMLKNTIVFEYITGKRRVK